MSFQGVYEFYLKEYGNHFVVDPSCIEATDSCVAINLGLF